MGFWIFYKAYMVEMDLYQTIDTWTLELNSEFFLDYSTAVDDWIHYEIAKAQGHIEAGKKLLVPSNVGDVVTQDTMVNVYREWTKCTDVVSTILENVAMGVETTKQNYEKVMVPLDKVHLESVSRKFNDILKTLLNDIETAMRNVKNYVTDQRPPLDKQLDDAHDALDSCRKEFDDHPNKDERKLMIHNCQEEREPAVIETKAAIKWLEDDAESKTTF